MDDRPADRSVRQELARVSCEHDGDVLVVSLAGEVDLANAATVESEIAGHCDGHAAVVLALDGLEYLDSSAIAMLLRLSESVAGRGAGVRLASAQGTHSRRLLELTRLEETLGTHESVEAAVRSFER